jgi:hypothetical protein
MSTKDEDDKKDEVYYDIIMLFAYIHVILSSIALILLTKKWDKLPKAIKSIVILSFFIAFAPFFSIILLLFY